MTSRSPPTIRDCRKVSCDRDMLVLALKDVLGLRLDSGRGPGRASVRLPGGNGGPSVVSKNPSRNRFVFVDGSDWFCRGVGIVRTLGRRSSNRDKR